MAQRVLTRDCCIGRPAIGYPDGELGELFAVVELYPVGTGL